MTMTGKTRYKVVPLNSTTQLTVERRSKAILRPLALDTAPSRTDIRLSEKLQSTMASNNTLGKKGMLVQFQCNVKFDV